MRFTNRDVQLTGTLIAPWDTALKTAGNRDYTLVVIPRANHAMLEAKVGSNAEVKSLQRFAPSYFTTIEDWLASGFAGSTDPAADALDRSALKPTESCRGPITFPLSLRPTTPRSETPRRG